MTKQTLPERMVKLETLMEQALSEIKEVRADIRVMSDSFVTKTEFREELTRVENQLTSFSKSSRVQNILSGMLGVVLTVLIGFFIANVGK